MQSIHLIIVPGVAIILFQIKVKSFLEDFFISSLIAIILGRILFKIRRRNNFLKNFLIKVWSSCGDLHQWKSCMLQSSYISGNVAINGKIWFAEDKLWCNSFTPVLQFYTSGKVAINGKDWVHQFDSLNLLQKCVNCVNRAWNKKLTDIWRPPFGWKWNEAASDLELFLPNVYCTVTYIFFGSILSSQSI